MVLDASSRTAAACSALLASRRPSVAFRSRSWDAHMAAEFPQWHAYIERVHPGSTRAATSTIAACTRSRRCVDAPPTLRSGATGSRRSRRHAVGRRWVRYRACISSLLGLLCTARTACAACVVAGGAVTLDRPSGWCAHRACIASLLGTLCDVGASNMKLGVMKPTRSSSSPTTATTARSFHLGGSSRGALHAVTEGSGGASSAAASTSSSSAPPPARTCRTRRCPGPRSPPPPPPHRPRPHFAPARTSHRRRRGRRPGTMHRPR